MITIIFGGTSWEFDNILTLQIISLGAVGQSIDFTINGTYTNSTGTQTLSVTGHVIRDN